jgi:Tol biopolymer transport system component
LHHFPTKSLDAASCGRSTIPAANCIGFRTISPITPPELSLTRDGSTLTDIIQTRIADIWIGTASDPLQARQLSSGDVYDRVAAGPAGKVLAASRNGDIFLLGTEAGSQPASIAPGAHNLMSVSSCDDRYLVFDSFRERRLELWRTDADGSNGVKLVDDTRTSECSPDGKWVVFISNKHAYRIPVEGGTPKDLLTHTPDTGVFNPRVSPDGTLIAMGYQEGLPVPADKLGVVTATGGELRAIGPYPIGSGGLRWSPDGKGVQYTLTRSGATNIWQQPLDGKAAFQLTKFTSGRIFDYNWSHDGKQLLLIRGTNNNDVIMISHFR